MNIRFGAERQNPPSALEFVKKTYPAATKR